MRFIKTYKYYIIFLLALIAVMILEFYFLNKYGEAEFMDYMLIVVIGISMGSLINDWIASAVSVMNFEIDSKNRIKVNQGYQFDNYLTNDIIKLLLYTMLDVFTEDDSNVNKDLIDEIFKIVDEEIESISEEYNVDPIEKKIILNPISEEENNNE